MENSDKESDATILRQKAEEQLKKKSAKTVSKLSEAEMLKFVHELQVHQIELEMENEKLMLANKQATNDTTNKYVELYEVAPTGYATLSKEGNICELNLAASQMLGKERSSIKNSKFVFYISDDTKSIFNLFLGRIFINEVKETCDVIILKNGIVPLYVQLTGIVSKDRLQCFVTMVDISERKQEENIFHRNTRFLGERVKELHCLYSISELVRKKDISQGIIWQESVNLLAQAYMYNEISTCCITIGECEYKTSNFKKTEWSQNREIIVYGEIVGSIEVCYLEKRPDEYDGPFLLEEEKLLIAVADLLGKSTERKQAEEKLRQLSQAIEQSPVSIVITDTSGSIQYVNSKFVEVSGYSFNEAIGKNPRILKSEHTSPEEYKQLWQTLTSGGVWHGEFHNKKKNGGLYWESATISPIVNTFGETTHFLAVKEDITDRMYVRKALRESEKRTRALIDNAPLGIALSRDGIIVDVNAAFLTLFGYADVGELHGTSLLNMIAPQCRDEMLHRERQRTSKENIERLYETTGIRKNNSQFPFLISQNTIIFSDGLLTISFFTDITDLKISQEKSRLHEQQLIQADKMASLGLLVSGVVHEINNPNNLVMFNCDLVSRIINDVTPTLDEYYEDHSDRLVGGLPYPETKKELEKLLKGISIGSQRIRDGVINLKDFARIDSGNMDHQIRINEIVKSALLIVGNLIKKSTDIFSVEYTDEIPNIVGNAQQIEQVIINLITNACQALVNKSQAIQIRTKFNSDENKILIVVSDEGIGISKEHVKRIFDPFFTTKMDSGGTGLGLSISHSIIQVHKGELQVKSVEGNGTTVTISLPANTLEKK